MTFKTILLTGLGFLLLLLGAVGLLLPVWPTTPFVLLSAACFSSAPRIKARIMGIPFFKEHIDNYERRMGLSKRTLRVSIIWLWSMLLLSMLISRTAWISILLLLVGAAVTTHILWMSRARGEKRSQP